MAQIELSIDYTRTLVYTREITVEIPDNLLVEDEDDRHDNVHEWLTDNQEKWAEDSMSTEQSDEVEIDEFAEVG